MNEQIRINWYRCKVDKAVMSELMRKSNKRGFIQVGCQLTLFFTTGVLAYQAYGNVHADNWKWAVPLVLAALFLHGTFGSFMGGYGPLHELSHKTPFRSVFWNEFFLKIYSFFSWSDYIGFRASHAKHHQYTVYHDLDGEAVLPSKLDWQSVKFFLIAFICNPPQIFRTLKGCASAATGRIITWGFDEKWLNQMIPESNVPLRRAHRRWAQTLVFGHLALAALFIATGHWFLVLVFNFGGFYCGWFSMLCGMTQHIGMSPDVPDFRLNSRTYTCSWFPAFLYWNMNYHVEHHMFPSVPFYNLPRLRQTILQDLPPATHGLWATWRQILSIVKKQREDPTYVFIPALPQNSERPSETEEIEKDLQQMVDVPA